MIKIRLFCAAGMSTSVLVSKMQEAAKAKGVEADIEAFPESAKKLCSAKGVPVDVINSVDYGMMKGDKVLDFALKMLGK